MTTSRAHRRPRSGRHEPWIALAIACILAVACRGAGSATPGPNDHADHADSAAQPGSRKAMTDDEALAALRGMPAWAEIEDMRPADVQRIETAVAQLAALEDTALRRVVARYIDDERKAHGELGVPAASRLYVLVRFVYAAPPRAP